MSESKFKIVVLGSGGGPRLSQASGYLVSPVNSSSFIALDAGSLLDGIEIAYNKGAFKEIALKGDLLPSIEILKEHVKAYLISHAHLDHIASLIINSQADSSKSILGTDETIQNIIDHLFNGKIWPNLGDEGTAPKLGKYHYHRLALEKKVTISGSAISATAFHLHHHQSCSSSAFLLEHRGEYILYFGDTSPMENDPSKHIGRVWKIIVPLLREKKVRAIFLECSYPTTNRSGIFFGHLDPEAMMAALDALAKEVSSSHPEKALTDLKVVVTHIKDSLKKGEVVREIIKDELEQRNNLGVKFLFPTQGDFLLV